MFNKKYFYIGWKVSGNTSNLTNASQKELFKNISNYVVVMIWQFASRKKSLCLNRLDKINIIRRKRINQMYFFLVGIDIKYLANIILEMRPTIKFSAPLFKTKHTSWFQKHFTQEIDKSLSLNNWYRTISIHWMLKLVFVLFSYANKPFHLLS